MKKIVRLTESDLSRIVKRIIKEEQGYFVPHNIEKRKQFKVGDASHDTLRGKGYSHRGKDDNQHYIMFKGEKFYDEDIVYADYNDMGEIPRIENGKLIIANPGWSN